MSEYKISELVDERVLNYRFSVKTKNDPEYIKLKNSVRVHNEQQRHRESAGLEPHYLRIRGRGRAPKISGPNNHYSVNDDNATYFDVYVQRDTDAMYRYRKRAATKKATSTAKGFIAKSVGQLNAILTPTQANA